MRNLSDTVATLIVALVLGVVYVHGDEPTDWRLVERCGLEESNAMDYTGSILASGWAGLHSISNDYETPIIRVFSDERWVSHGSPIQSLQHVRDHFHALSPDGRWLAVVAGNLDMDCPPCWRGQLTTSHILVYDVNERGRPWLIPYSGVYDFGRSRNLDYRSFYVNWLDNDTLILPEVGVFPFDAPAPGAVALNPFDGSAPQSIELVVSLYDKTAFIASPNWRWIITQLDIPPNYNNPWYLVDLTETIANQPLEATDNLNVAWSNASDHLIVMTHQDMRLLSVNAPVYESNVMLQHVEPVYTLAGKTYMSWSYDDRFVAYLAQDFTYSGNAFTGVLHIVDLEQQLIFNTCQLAVSFKWSPASYQIALATDPFAVIPDSQTGKVRVMDIEQWRIFTVAAHVGHVVAWVE